MKAAVFYGKKDLRIEDIPMPAPRAGEVLVKVRACGICGTDVHIFNGDEGAAKTPAGTALGHEFAGEVVGVGEGVTRAAVGDRVCVDPNKLCGNCDYCLGGIGHYCEHMTGIGTTVNGGFEEYVSVPESQVYRVPDNVTYGQAAMTEPVSCCLHGIDLCGIKPGQTVAVIGCGMIGLLMLQLARLSGAAKLIAVEPVAVKREQALKLGADLVLDPAELSSVTLPRIDCVIECVGRVETMKTAVSIAGNCSTVMLFGLTAPSDTMEIRPFDLFKREITIKASFINPYTFGRALALIGSGKLDVSSMVAYREPLSELPAILADPARRREGKVIIECDR
ncbi:MAG: zinc-dependent alcohol dehydrogenase family protein [Clostridia bacterium]|nr:zinc-dependent alcohol dehydrogenase family protein [Clostridia bacterium]